MVNLGSALAILGLLVPVYTRLKTEKNHKKELMEEHANKNKPITQENSKENVTISQKHGNSSFAGTFNNMNVCNDNNKTFQSFRKIAQERKEPRQSMKPCYRIVFLFDQAFFCHSLNLLLQFGPFDVIMISRRFPEKFTVFNIILPW